MNKNSQIIMKNKTLCKVLILCKTKFKSSWKRKMLRTVRINKSSKKIMYLTVNKRQTATSTHLNNLRYFMVNRVQHTKGSKLPSNNKLCHLIETTQI